MVANVLIALPPGHPVPSDLDGCVRGAYPVSGTLGSFLRAAFLLQRAGFHVAISSDAPARSSMVTTLSHDGAARLSWDAIVAHQGHWAHGRFTFGPGALAGAHLWLQNKAEPTEVEAFLKSGGRCIIGPSRYCCGLFRHLPQWPEKFAVIYNTFCPVFNPSEAAPEPYVLFVGAVRPEKGFEEFMAVVSYMMPRAPEVRFGVAGGMDLHGSTELGTLGIASGDYERRVIEPWLRSLPRQEAVELLGSLDCTALKHALARASAVVVNPSRSFPETFCCSAVEAQACNRVVFTVNEGGLQETVYPGDGSKLCRGGPEDLARLLLEHLEQPMRLKDQGVRAGDFVRRVFSDERILRDWVAVLNGERSSVPTRSERSTPKDLVLDMVRRHPLVRRAYERFLRLRYGGD